MHTGIYPHVKHLHCSGYVENQFGTHSNLLNLCSTILTVFRKLYFHKVSHSDTVPRVMEARRCHPWIASALWEAVVIRGPAHEYAGGMI